jgi:hypothetical protein
MSFTLCTSEAIITKAGKNASSTAITSSAILQQFSNEAESFICMATRYDWVGNYSAIVSYAKYILGDAASCIAGNQIMNYDPSGYTGRGEYEDMININYDKAGRIIEYLKKYKFPEDTK